MKHLAYMLSAILFAPLSSADERFSSWTQGTSLESCSECKSTAFHENVRKHYANQLKNQTNYAAASGYVVIKSRNTRLYENGIIKLGRMALMGTGRIARTPSHVLFKSNNGELRKGYDHKIYFMPMFFPGHLIEIDQDTIQYGAKITDVLSKSSLDWANVYLKEDAIRKFKKQTIFALLWDKQVTHEQMQTDRYRRSSNYVFGLNTRLLMNKTCNPVSQRPSDFYKDNQVSGIIFADCPMVNTRKGSSGSTVTLTKRSGIYFAMQIVTKEFEAPASGPTGSGKIEMTPQGYLALTVESKESLNRMYVQDLRSRGVVIDVQ